MTSFIKAWNVADAVLWTSSSHIHTWWYTDRRSNLVKKHTPWSSSTTGFLEKKFPILLKNRIRKAFRIFLKML